MDRKTNRKAGPSSAPEEVLYALRSKIQVTTTTEVGRGDRIGSEAPRRTIQDEYHQVSHPTLNSCQESKDSFESIANLNSSEGQSKESFELQLLYFPPDGEPRSIPVQYIKEVPPLTNVIDDTFIIRNEGLCQVNLGQTRNSSPAQPMQHNIPQIKRPGETTETRNTALIHGTETCLHE